eukprot:1410712-Prymnesium_polylepis.1
MSAESVVRFLVDGSAILIQSQLASSPSKPDQGTCGFRGCVGWALAVCQRATRTRHTNMARVRDAQRDASGVAHISV